MNVEILKNSLLIERAAYVAKNKLDRVAEVDLALARLDGLLSTGITRPLGELVTNVEKPLEQEKPKRKPTKPKAK